MLSGVASGGFPWANIFFVPLILIGILSFLSLLVVTVLMFVNKQYKLASWGGLVTILLMFISTAFILFGFTSDLPIDQTPSLRNFSLLTIGFVAVFYLPCAALFSIGRPSAVGLSVVTVLFVSSALAAYFFGLGGSFSPPVNDSFEDLYNVEVIEGSVPSTPNSSSTVTLLDGAKTLTCEVSTPESVFNVVCLDENGTLTKIGS